MFSKTLLFLSAESLHAYTWRRGTLSGEVCFADSPQGHQQFTEFLTRYRDPAYLLTDLVEEDFRHETLPHLRGAERKALIQRKLEQYYRNTPFLLAKTLQRRPEGRRDDDMLLSALTNPALLMPWINIMQTLNTPLVGIYSIPHISTPLVPADSSARLLLSWEKCAGLRQTYFDNGLLRFSRLTPVNANHSFVATVEAEAPRTQQYLRNLSLLPSTSALEVAIICHASDRSELEAQLHNTAEMSYAYLDIQELGRKIGSNTIFPDSDATPLFLQLLAVEPPRIHYAAAVYTHALRVVQLHRILLGLSVALSVGGLLWTAANIEEYRAMEHEFVALQAAVAQVSQQTELTKHSDPATQTSAIEMKTVVTLSHLLSNSSPPPRMLLDGLAHTLDSFPNIHLDKLSWQAGSTALDAASPNAAISDEMAIPSTQEIMFNGTLTPVSGGFREALAYLGRFQQDLTQRGYSVTTQSLPLDISPQGSIAADIGDGSDKPAQFSFKLIWQAAK